MIVVLLGCCRTPCNPQKSLKCLCYLSDPEQSCDPEYTVMFQKWSGDPEHSGKADSAAAFLEGALWSSVPSSEPHIFLHFLSTLCWYWHLWMSCIICSVFQGPPVANISMVTSSALWCPWWCSGGPDCIMVFVRDAGFHIHFLVFLNFHGIFLHLGIFWLPRFQMHGLKPSRSTWDTPKGVSLQSCLWQYTNISGYTQDLLSD